MNRGRRHHSAISLVNHFLSESTPQSINSSVNPFFNTRLVSRSSHKMASQAEVWGFPYESPYQIQLDLMKELKECIEARQLGLFESPTGTVRKSHHQ